MVIWLLRVLLFTFTIFLIFRAIKYILSPKRKLELAQEQKRFFLLDDPEDVRKNFLLTYKGALFEGEKYLGTTSHAFEIVSIFLWPRDNASLKGLDRMDFQLIADKVHERYPNAKIDWKSPIKEFLEQ